MPEISASSYWRRVARQALQNTRHFFGWNKRTLVVPILFLAGSLVHFSRLGFEAMKQQVDVYVSYAVTPICGFTILLFLWHMLRVPAQMESDAEEEAADLRAQIGSMTKQGEELDLFYDPVHPCEQVHIERDPSRGEHKTRIFRVGVRNNSERTIKNVRVRLEDMGNYHNANLPAVLRPRHQHSDNIDLSPHETDYVEVASLQETSATDEIILHYHNVKLRGQIPRGKYRLKLKVYGDDIRPLNRFFFLKVSKKGELLFGPWVKGKLTDDD